MKTFTFLIKKYAQNVAHATSSLFCSQQVLGFYDFEVYIHCSAFGGHNVTFTEDVSGFADSASQFNNERLTYNINATNS